LSLERTKNTMTSEVMPFGRLLKQWREQRRLSQEALADDAECSTRHLSFLESGKSAPSREMVLVLASALDLPLRDRNVLLGAAGFAAVYRESPLDADAMAPFQRALDVILAKQEPYGAVVFDRGWNVIQMNRGALALFGRFPQATSDPKIAMNLVRSLFHPDGLRRHVVNWREVAALTFERLELPALREEIMGYQDVPRDLFKTGYGGGPFVTVHLKNGADEVRLFTLLTTLGTSLDVTAQELTIESYFPADADSERYLKTLNAG
jgi:transcriptional regulator with XRE-family HTH domain